MSLLYAYYICNYFRINSFKIKIFSYRVPPTYPRIILTVGLFPMVPNYNTCSIAVFPFTLQTWSNTFKLLLLLVFLWILVSHRHFVGWKYVFCHISFRFCISFFKYFHFCYSKLYYYRIILSTSLFPSTIYIS